MKTKAHIPTDPLARFTEIYAALTADHRWWHDESKLRFASLATLTCPGDPELIARGIRVMSKEMERAAKRRINLNTNLRFLLGAMLLSYADDPHKFFDAVERVRTMFRKAKLPRSLPYEIMTVLILRIGGGGRPVSRATVARVAELHREMKRHHRFLTGADDLPACALLAGQEGSPEEILENVESIYRSLRARRFNRGQALQTAANVLYLTKGDPDRVADRFAALAAEFKDRRVRIWESDYDELAILTFLEHPASLVVSRVQEHRKHLEALRPRLGRQVRFDVAAAIAFIDLMQRDIDGRLVAGTLAKVKTMMDMQAVIAAQQAAAVAAVAAASAAAASG